MHVVHLSTICGKKRDAILYGSFAKMKVYHQRVSTLMMKNGTRIECGKHLYSATCQCTTFLQGICRWAEVSSVGGQRV